MARLAESLQGYLRVHGGLSALIGTRVYPMQVPQRPTLPAVTYQQISRRPVHVKPGVIRPIVAVRMQFDVLATSYSDVDAVAGQLRSALYGFGATVPWTYSALVQSERDFDAPELQQFRRSVDVMIWYAEE